MKRRRKRWPGRAGWLLLALLWGVAPAGRAAASADEVAKIRLLAENSTQRAYDEAARLLARLPAGAPASERAQALNLLARIEIHLSRTDQAGEHIAQALALATAHGDRIGIVEAELNQALNSVNQGKIDALVAATTHSLAVLEGLDHPVLLTEALLRTAMMYRRIGQTDESVSLTMRAMEVARRSGNHLALNYAYQGLGVSFGQSGRPSESRDYFLKMRAEARLVPSKLQEAYATIGVAAASSQLGDARAAEALARESIALFREIGAPFGLNHGLFSLADQYRRQGRYAETIPILNDVIARYKLYPNNIGRWYSLNARSDNYLSLRKRGLAQADAERAYALAKEMNMVPFLSESAQRIAGIAAAAGDYRRAYALSVEAAELAAKAAGEKSSARMLELARRHQSESKQREIDELTRRNARQQAELAQRTLHQRWMLTVLLAIAGVLAITGFFLLRLRRSHGIIRGLNASLEQRVQARTAELRQQTRYLRALIDALPWRVWLKDTASRYLALNQAAADTCGQSADALVGKSDLDVHAPALADASLRDDREVMSARRGRTVEALLPVGGGLAWMETFRAPVFDEDGSVLGTVGFARDISERKAVETAREAALAEAQRLAQVRSDFLAQMSHELRTPLNGILGYSQILRHENRLDARQLDGLNVIEQCGEHLLGLINDILDLAKIEAGKLELHPGPVALARFLGEIGDMVRLKAQQKGLGFECELEPGLPDLVEADEQRLRQVLLNLLSNAVKFTDRGQVRLAVAAGADGRLRFEVADSGVGIGQDQLEAIFLPFEQSGDSRQRAGGTGLGLAIARQCARLMGGEVRVESRVGEGSRFWFELALPAMAGPALLAHPVPRPIGYLGPRRSILVVDDVAANRNVASAMLGRLGFAMAEAASGLDALRLAMQEAPDLVLMDMAMPGMDGLETARRLRALPTLAAVPIIAVSAGTPGKEQQQRYRDAGMDAFLPSPIAHDGLLALVAAQLQLHWRYAPPPLAPAPVAGPPAALPDAAAMDALHRLARMGNMRDILDWARKVAELDPSFQQFAEQVGALARGYQSKAILELASRHVETGPDS